MVYAIREVLVTVANRMKLWLKTNSASKQTEAVNRSVSICTSSWIAVCDSHIVSSLVGGEMLNIVCSSQCFGFSVEFRSLSVY